MVRVIWARLLGWIDVDELLDIILDLSIAVHGSVTLTARSGHDRATRSGWDALVRTVGVCTAIAVQTHGFVATRLKPSKIN